MDAWEIACKLYPTKGIITAPEHHNQVLINIEKKRKRAEIIISAALSSSFTTVLVQWVKTSEKLPSKDGIYFCLVHTFGKDQPEAVREFIAEDGGFEFDDVIYWLDGVSMPEEEDSK